MTQIWRRANECVTVGHQTTIEVLAVGQSFVRLAISRSGESPSYEEVELSLDPEQSAERRECELGGRAGMRF